MADRAELRRLAEAAREMRPYLYAVKDPDVVLGLLDEIDQLRAVAVRLKGALEKLACLGNGDRPGNSHGKVIAQQALDDPEVEEL